MASCPLIPTELPMQTCKFKSTLHSLESNKHFHIVWLDRKSTGEFTRQSSILKFISVPCTNSLHSFSITCGRCGNLLAVLAYISKNNCIPAVSRVWSKWLAVFFSAVGFFNSLRWAGAPLAARETHIFNGRLYVTAELPSQSIFILVEARQDQRCGIWSSCRWLTNSVASESLHK